MDKTGRTALYGAGHFLVDFACALALFRVVRGTAVWAEASLYYNFCAFALQLPLGLAADRLGHSARFAALGAGLTALALALGGQPVLLCVVAGLGNALYHVGGGLAVLRAYPRRAGPLGVYVSPGALGIFLGTLLGKGGAFPLLPAAAALAALAVALCRLKDPDLPTVPLSLSRAGPLAAVPLLFLVVCLRALLGFVFAFPWRTGAWAWAAVCGVALGKAAGGYLADWLGARRAALLSLGLAAVLFLLSDGPVWGVAAVFLFNMTMPFTLRAAADLFPDAQGFSFGLLTFALFLGFVPAWLGLTSFGSPAVYAVGALLSLALLLPGLGRRSP